MCSCPLRHRDRGREQHDGVSIDELVERPLRHRPRVPALLGVPRESVVAVEIDGDGVELRRAPARRERVDSEETVSCFNSVNAYS